MLLVCLWPESDVIIEARPLYTAAAFVGKRMRFLYNARANRPRIAINQAARALWILPSGCVPFAAGVVDDDQLG